MESRHSIPPASVRHLAFASGAAVSVLCAVYVIVLAIGLVTLPAPDRPIQDPWFTSMELLILLIAPAMVFFAVAVHATVEDARRAFALAGVSFLCMCAGLTSVVHFSVLTLSRHASFASEGWARSVFAFEWPSVVYALDILAWDVFFPFGAGCLALSLAGTPRSRAVQLLLAWSALLSFAGLAGIPLADMQVRNIGIVGYAVVFPVATAIFARRRSVS